MVLATSVSIEPQKVATAGDVDVRPSCTETVNKSEIKEWRDEWTKEGWMN